MNKQEAWFQGWPVFIEKGGLGRGWWGPPKGTHGSGAQEGEVQVGITSALPGRTVEQVRAEMDEFRAVMEKTPVKNLSVQLGTGGWEGGSEPTWVTQYDGDGEALKVLAQTGKKWDQDAVLVMKHVTKGGQPQTRFAFAETISEPEMRLIETVLVERGLEGWTWARRGGKLSLEATNVPDWGGHGPSHEASANGVLAILKDADVDVSLGTSRVDVTVMDKGNYDDFIQG